MSNANKPAKVLRTAFRRIQKGWVQRNWSNRNKQTGVTEVCIEGAIFGYKNDSQNPACMMAKNIVMQVINEKHKTHAGERYLSIPQFNDDPRTTKVMVEDVMKTALVRAETGGLLRETEEECYEPSEKFL